MILSLNNVIWLKWYETVQFVASKSHQRSKNLAKKCPNASQCYLFCLDSLSLSLYLFKNIESHNLGALPWILIM